MISEFLLSRKFQDSDFTFFLSSFTSQSLPSTQLKAVPQSIFHSAPFPQRTVVIKMLHSFKKVGKKNINKMRRLVENIKT